MPGETPREAVQNYMAPLQQAVSCVCKAVLRPTSYEPSDTPHLLYSEQMPCLLARTKLCFDVSQKFRIIEDLQYGPWRITTAGYKYTIETADGEEILGYHWHPESRSQFREPHLHLGYGAKIGRRELESTKAHLPTGRVAMEDFIRLLIEVFEANPRNDWKDVLNRTAQKFWQYATWGRPPGR